METTELRVWLKNLLDACAFEWGKTNLSGELIIHYSSVWSLILTDIQWLKIFHVLIKKPAMVCFNMAPIALEFRIPQRATRDITNVLETIIKHWWNPDMLQTAVKNYMIGTYSFHIYIEIMEACCSYFILKD